MTTDELARALSEVVAGLERIAESQERIARELEQGSAARHHELMSALADVLQALDKIERTQYG